MLEINVNRRRGGRSHRVVPRNLGTSVPRIATRWRVRGCSNETSHGAGLGWNEGTTDDVLCEILHVYTAHVKKVLALAGKL